MQQEGSIYFRRINHDLPIMSKPSQPFEICFALLPQSLRHVPLKTAQSPS
jgi:hypothetical protein